MVSNKDGVKRLKELSKELMDTIEKKNSDYSDDKDFFFNFKTCEYFLDIDPLTGILIRMGDKYSRVCKIRDSNPKVKNESLKDALLDLAGYALISALYIEPETKKKN